MSDFSYDSYAQFTFDGLNYNHAATTASSGTILDQDNDDDFDPATSRQIRRGSLKHTRSTVHRVHSLHDEFHSHELALQVEQEKRQNKERRKTLHRV